MIEFSGEMSKKCKKFILVREGQAGWVGGTITAIIFIFPTVIASVNSGELIYLIFVPVFVLVPFFAGPPPLFMKKALRLVIPTRVVIEDDGLIISESDKFHLEGGIENVEKVIDYGEWYKIIFQRGYRSARYVCQKSLITKGTLEEFEKLFEGKIKRKNNLKT